MEVRLPETNACSKYLNFTSAFVGLASILLLSPLPGYVAKRVQDVQSIRLKKTDARVQSVTESKPNIGWGFISLSIQMLLLSNERFTHGQAVRLGEKDEWESGWKTRWGTYLDMATTSFGSYQWQLEVRIFPTNIYSRVHTYLCLASWFLWQPWLPHTRPSKLLNSYETRLSLTSGCSVSKPRLF